MMRQRKRITVLGLMAATLLGTAALPGRANAVQMAALPPQQPLQLGIPFPILPSRRVPGMGFGLLRLSLQVQPGCDVDLPRGEPVDDLRIACSSQIAWLANLTPPDDASSEFVTLDFMPVGQAWAPRPIATPNRPFGRLNVDY